MNWTMVGALGEFFGAIAVVASLLYVGHQVRQNNRIASAEAYRDVTLSWARMLHLWADDAPAASSPLFQDSWMALRESYSPDFRSFFESRYRFDDPSAGEADRP